MNRALPDTTRQRAAAYVRMSTEHQRYSTTNQLAVIREYARQRNWEIVSVYSDEGKSGLKIKGRTGLAQMIRDVLTKNANFTHILVYDVSRWGRFQDPDEAAHYEFICRDAGATVNYCAEQFKNDGGLSSTLAKNLKRVMAGEYSRELSTKVFRGASHLIQLGFKQGGSAGYGLRRMLVDQNGRSKGLLKNGEQKNLHTDRVVFVPGPDEENRVVRWVFEAFVNERKGPTEITRLLNQRSIPSPTGRPWTDIMIRNLLRNENYIGNLVYARVAIKLSGPRVVHPPEKWIRKENAFPSIVSRELFFKAQELIAAARQSRQTTNEVMVEMLRALLSEHGHLTSGLVKRHIKSPHVMTFRNRFGSLHAAYRLAGFDPGENASRYEIASHLGKVNRELVAEMIRQLRESGATAVWNGQSRVLCINDELRVAIIQVRHRLTNYGFSRWPAKNAVLRGMARVRPDLALVVRMDRNNEGVHDYYLFPVPSFPMESIYFTEQNGSYLDAHRHQTLDFLAGLAARAKFSQDYETRNTTDTHRPDPHHQSPASGSAKI